MTWPFAYARVLTSVRLVSGLVLMAFVTSHLLNLCLGVISLELVEDWHGFFIAPWQTSIGEVLLASAMLVHMLIGLWSIAARRSLSMRGRDLVQLVLGLLVLPLLLAHVLSMRVSGELVSDFSASYSFILAVYWNYAPILAFQQLFVVVIVWIHGAIGLYAWMVLQRWWPRIGGLVLPLLFAVPIVALLGFVESGKEVLRRLGDDPVFRQGLEQNLAKLTSVQPRLAALHAEVVTLYLWGAGLAIAILLARILVARRDQVSIDYDGGLRASGRLGLSILEISRTNHIPHANICGGRGRCATCRVLVEAGAEALSPAGALEKATLAFVEAHEGVRLACQARLVGPHIRVARLIPAFADARAARAPGTWLLESAAPKS
jgi:adenylate cyclase